jgi:hypothetical protein
MVNTTDGFFVAMCMMFRLGVEEPGGQTAMLILRNRQHLTNYRSIKFKVLAQLFLCKFHQEDGGVHVVVFSEKIALNHAS